MSASGTGGRTPPERPRLTNGRLPPHNPVVTRVAPELQHARSVARHSLGADDVRNAYRRWAGVYDAAFGSISAVGRRHAAALVNLLPGQRVLEMGVGTGLALPRYDPRKRITGIDLSADMLERARSRVDRLGLANIDDLMELDAERTGLPAASFDVAVAMFVASVVPDPARLLAEMRRLVRPSGTLVFVNHFSAQSGPRLWVERALAPAGRKLGWHPDFPMEALLPPVDRARAVIQPLPPGGLFTLVRLDNT